MGNFQTKEDFNQKLLSLLLISLRYDEIVEYAPDHLKYIFREDDIKKLNNFKELINYYQIPRDDSHFDFMIIDKENQRNKIIESYFKNKILNSKENIEGFIFQVYTKILQ